MTNLLEWRFENFFILSFVFHPLEIFKSKSNFVKSLHKIKVQGRILGNNIFLFFFSVDRPNLSEPKKVENLQNKVISSLRDHVTYNPDAQRKGSQYFSRILDRLPVLRTLSSDGCQKLFYLKVESQYPVSPILEKIMMSNLPFWHYYHSESPFKFWSTSNRPLRRLKCKQTQRKSVRSCDEGCLVI